jgi:hypothetical protein
MSPNTTDRLREPLAQVRERIEKVPKSAVGLVVGVALVVAIGIWVWPEIQRTIRIHRM